MRMQRTISSHQTGESEAEVFYGSAIVRQSLTHLLVALRRPDQRPSDIPVHVGVPLVPVATQVGLLKVTLFTQGGRK